MKHTSLPKTRNEFLLETLYAGLFTGSAVALLFLVIDISSGLPLWWIASEGTFEVAVGAAVLFLLRVRSSASASTPAVE